MRNSVRSFVTTTRYAGACNTLYSIWCLQPATTADSSISGSTHFDPEPRVGIRHIDLLKLYNRVIGEGGYDLCSDTKAKPLMWRKLAEEFVGKNVYTAAQAFQIKSVYYKNLCAYEISAHWGKTPPPREIFEDLTAKGGNVMGRTLENFQRPAPKEESKLHGDDSDSSREHTPSRQDKMEEDPGSASGRTSRGLRQQPPQRVLFQPDLTSARQVRGHTQPAATSPGAPAATLVNGYSQTIAMTNGASATLASYEPPQSYPLSLKPVVTPANNPEFYRNERKRKLEVQAGPLAKKYRNIMLPGTGFIGPNIYVRAQLALQSGLPEEEQYALHHLVKISHERGDKYRFDQFPGLAEALLRKALQVSGLFYDVEWEVSYESEMNSPAVETLNGLRGTSDIIKRLTSRTPLLTLGTVLDAKHHSQLHRVLEAGLVIRNMCMLEENASYASTLPLTLDYLTVVLWLPRHPSIVELQHYALESAEQILKYSDIDSYDALYHSLISHVECQDRGANILALKSLSRIAMHLTTPKRLDFIPWEVLQRVHDWLLVEDEDLRCACLDFLMQYTSFADNVEELLQAIDVDALARQLSRLLLSGSREHKEPKPQKQQERSEAASPIPRLSRDVVLALLKIEEPERSSEWLRMCFVADPVSEMTQISLWQAYQSTFQQFSNIASHMIAGDFIKNVSATFPGATAQVATSTKYVIKGIKARRAPVEAMSRGVERRELHKCFWQHPVLVEGPRDPSTNAPGPPITQDTECAEWFRTGKDIMMHVFIAHLKLPVQRAEAPESGGRMDVDVPIVERASSTPVNGMPNGKPSNPPGTPRFDFRLADQTVYSCKWSTCKRTSADFPGGNVSRTHLLARHIQTHLPSANQLRSNAGSNKPPDSPPDSTGTYFTTLQDEKGDAAGVPLGAVLVLRNIARFMPRHSSNGQEVRAVDATATATTEGNASPPPVSLMDQVFDEGVKRHLFFNLAHNRTLREYVGTVLRTIKANSV